MEKIVAKESWSDYNKSQVKEKELFMKLLHEMCKELEPEEYKFGRPKLSISDIAFVAILKIYSTFSGRRFSSDIRDAKERQLINQTLHYNSLFKYLQSPYLNKVLKELVHRSAEPLSEVETNFAVDSTAFSGSKFEQWIKNRGVGRKGDKRMWVKCHAISGCLTNVITDAIVTPAEKSDHPYLQPLVESTGKRFKINEVMADKAYTSRHNLQVIVDQGGLPYIPFKKNATARPYRSTVWRQAYHYFMMHQAEFYKHYHQRSNIENTFSMIKAKFGSSIRSKVYQSQENEVLCKVIAHNICCVIRAYMMLNLDPNSSFTNKP